MNITFTGNIYNTSGSLFPNNEVRYQLYFYKVNTNSSQSTWGSTRLSEYGQYNINLGDSDLLSNDGKANVDDIVLITFWTPNSSIRSDSNLTEWGFIETPLTSASNYVADVQLKGGQTPTANFTISGATTISNNVIVTDESSHDNHSWTYNGTTIYQSPSKYSQPLFYSMNTLPSDAVSITWDDGQFTNDRVPASSYTHQYTLPDNYNVTAYITNTSGLSASQLFLRQIYYNTPTCNFSISDNEPHPVGTTGIGELVSFTNTTTDPDGRSSIDGWYCDWSIADGISSVTYDNKTLSFNPDHEFHSSGIHAVTLTLHWYNGATWTTLPISKNVTQLEWTVTNGLTWPTPIYVNTEYRYTPDITGDTSYVSRVSIVIDGTLVYSNLGINSTFNHFFYISDTHSIQQNIYYNTGFADSVQSQTFSVVMSPTADYIVSDDICGDRYTSTSEPGKQPITMYKWKVYLNNVEIASLEGPFVNVFRYNWPTTGTFYVWHEITDLSNQTASVVKTYPVAVCKGGGSQPLPATGGFAGGGGVVVRERPLPVIKVVYKKEKKKKITIEVKPINL